VYALRPLAHSATYVAMTRKRIPASSSPARVVGYVRVSTDDQALGPAAQREALERWCSQHGAELVAVLEDLGVSGAAPLDRRPGLLEALEALEPNGATVLLVAKRDRLARDPIVAAMIEASVAREGARVASAAEAGTEGDDPSAILMRRMVDAFAEYERHMIRARTRAALAVKRTRGERTGEVPYGWRTAPDGVHLEEHPEEARAVALVRELRAAGVSIRAIASRLEAAGAPARGNRWHATTVARLLERGAA